MRYFSDPTIAQHRAEQAASVLPPLQVAAERVATTVAQGVHGRRRVGQGETFWQFRSYQDGDSATRIDWRQSAKSRHVFVRETEWEAAQSVWVWHDGSPSMDYTSSQEFPRKGERGALLALALAALLMRGGERFSQLGSGRLPMSGRAAFERFAQSVFYEDTVQNSLPLPELLPRHGHVVLFGDFFSPLPEVAEVILGFATQGVHGSLVQIVDPAEETLPFSGRVVFSGMENEGKTTIGRVESIRKSYCEKLEAHCNGVADIAHKAGWHYQYHRTDNTPERALLSLYTGLAAR
jgi:uncharacterized protein (DUF58 family)